MLRPAPIRPRSLRAMRTSLVLTLCAAVALAAAPADAATAPRRPLSFLHAGRSGGPSALPQVLDPGGRQVQLRGVNVDGIVDYWRPDLRVPYPNDPAAYRHGACPPDDPTIEGVRVCDFDFSQMRPLGYDAIRLNLSWSLLEPRPGQIDRQYIDRIAQVVAWAKARGIYTVLDMHQDAWSKYVYTHPGETCTPPLQATRGYDGAPEWASQHASPACALNGTRELDAAVAETFQKFWANAAGPDGRGLQDHYADVVTALARRFRDEPAVAGYELMNEPLPGFTADPVASNVTEMFPFYGKVVKAVTARVPRFRQLFFVEPNALRNVTDARQVFTPWSDFSSYPNVVYAPHIYTGVFTADALAGGPRTFSMDTGYRNAIDDSKALGLPLWVGEFGNNPDDDDTLLRSHYELQDANGVPGALWLWKENANDTNPNAFWGIYGPPFGSGTVQPKRVAYTSRAYPLALNGDLRSMAYSPQAHSFRISASGARPVRCGRRSGATVIFVPASVRARVSASGARVAVYARGGGSREVYVYPTRSSYRVSSGGPAATRCPVAGKPRAHTKRHHGGSSPSFTG
jgi:endoglycosylceramidase